MSRSRPERSLHMRFQRLSPSHFSGWTQRWRTSTSLISQMVSTCCTASALRPGFQHERSRLFRKSAAISSSAITAFALLSAPRLAPIRPASSRGSRRGETDRLCGIGGPPRNAGCTRGFGAGARTGAASRDEGAGASAGGCATKMRKARAAGGRGGKRRGGGRWEEGGGRAAGGGEGGGDLEKRAGGEGSWGGGEAERLEVGRPLDGGRDVAQSVVRGATCFGAKDGIRRGCRNEHAVKRVRPACNRHGGLVRCAGSSPRRRRGAPIC